MESVQPMKTLVINCSLKSRSEELVAAVNKFSTVLLADFSLIDERHLIGSDIDAVIISGSGARIVHPAERQMFSSVIKLIKTCERPLLGICYGHQLLCYAFGADVGALPEEVLRFENVRLLADDEVFSGFKSGQIVPIFESHHDYVLKNSLERAGMILLADAPSCEVEAVKHKSKPFYGFQFHPERITFGNVTHPEGQQLIENFCRKIVKK